MKDLLLTAVILITLAGCKGMHSVSGEVTDIARDSRILRRSIENLMREAVYWKRDVEFVYREGVPHDQCVALINNTHFIGTFEVLGVGYGYTKGHDGELTKFISPYHYVLLEFEDPRLIDRLRSTALFRGYLNGVPHTSQAVNLQIYFDDAAETFGCAAAIQVEERTSYGRSYVTFRRPPRVRVY